MKRWTIFISVLLMIVCSGCSVNKTPSEPIGTVSPTPQVQQPTDDPEVSSTPTLTSTPSVAEPEPTKTNQPESTESHSATTPANPAETRKPEPSVSPTDPTPKPVITTPTETPKPEPTAPPVTESPKPTAPPVTETPKPTTAPSTEPDSGLKWEDYDLADALNDNKEFLDTYVDTPTNFLISLLGFDGLVNQIKDTAKENVTLTDVCIPLVGEITDINVAAEYHQSFVDINSRMAACNERTLEVKQNRDVGSFESALSDTVEVLQDYQALLESFKEEMGG